jgi:hypothetical protein
MSESTYRAGIRAAARGVWNGSLSQPQGLQSMYLTIGREITRAWNEGAAECGIRPDEFTFEELLARDNFIIEQENYAPGFIDFVIQNLRANGGKWGTITPRIELWVNKYRLARTRSAASACANKKKVWVLGATEKHCDSCLKFEGRVYRYQTWAENGATPQSRRLCCGGWLCDCSLDDTDERITPGRFPAGALCY